MNKATHRLKINEEYHIEFTKILIEYDVVGEPFEPQVLSMIFSDESELELEKEVPVFEYLEGVKLYFTEHQWVMQNREWFRYPVEVMNRLTTLEETKAPTCIILVE